MPKIPKSTKRQKNPCKEEPQAKKLKIEKEIENDIKGIYRIYDKTNRKKNNIHFNR